MIDYKNAQKFQEVIDTADPFLVEALSNKSLQELFEYQEKFEKQYEVLTQMQNNDTVRMAVNTRKVIACMISLKQHQQLVKRLEEQGHDDTDGFSLV